MTRTTRGLLGAAVAVALLWLGAFELGYRHGKNLAERSLAREAH